MWRGIAIMKLKINPTVLSFIVLLGITSIHYLINIDIGSKLIMYLLFIFLLFLFKKINMEIIVLILFCIDSIHQLKFNFWGTSIYYNQLYVLLLLFIFFLGIPFRNRINIRIPRIYVLAILYIIINFLFNMLNRVPLENWNVSLIILLSIIESIIVYNLCKKLDFERILNLYLYSFLFNFFLMILEVIVSPDQEAFCGLMLEPNISGSFYATAIILSLGSYKATKQSISKYLMIAFTIGIILSVTRASWISVILCLIVFFLIENIMIKSKMRFKSVILATLSICIAIGTLVTNPTILDKGSLFFYKIINLFEFKSGTGAFRLFMFKQAIDTIATNPFWGRGTSSFGLYYNYDVGMSGLQNHEAYLPNLYLGSLFDTGLLGFLTLSFFLCLICFKLFKIIQEDCNYCVKILSLSLLMGFISFLICYNLTSAFWFPGFWNYIAIVCLAIDKYKLSNEMIKE